MKSNFALQFGILSYILSDWIIFRYSTDMMPFNITAATEAYGHYNLMPVYGNILQLNWYKIIW